MAKAYFLEQDADGRVQGHFGALESNQLPEEGDVLVEVHYSTVNYKDGMILAGLGRLVRRYPHVGGIDLAGIVRTSSDSRYRPGDRVLLTGWRVGETWWGGYAQLASVRADWLVPLPQGLSLKTAMACGTGGFTAMLAIHRLEQAGLKPEAGAVLVTGAAGGVGSFAVRLLAKLGYQVAVLSGRLATEMPYLQELGAQHFLERDTMQPPGQPPEKSAGRPLEKELWAATIDSVGGPVLGRVLAQTSYGGSVAAVGLAGGVQWSGNVLPFLLRGVSLLGIDSVMCPSETRRLVWARLAEHLEEADFDKLATYHAFDELPELGKKILAGEIRGRAVLALREEASEA